MSSNIIPMSQQQPNDWRVEPLCRLVDFWDGQRIPLKQEVRDGIEGSIPYYGASGVIDYVNDFLFDDDLILLGEDGENVVSRNLPLAFKIAGKSWVNNHAHVLKPLEVVDINFLTAYLESLDYSGIASGSAQPKITQRRLQSVLIHYPPLPQQRKIARILTTVDNLIEKTEALIAKYQAIKQGMMHDLFTRGVDEHGHLRPPYEQAPELYKQSELGWIPKEWEVNAMVDLTLKIVDGVHHTPEYVEHGIPFVTVKNLTQSDGIDWQELNYISNLDHSSFILRADPKSGDVLVTKDGTLGVARIVPKDVCTFSIFVSVALLRPNPAKCLSKLIWLFFDSGTFLTQMGRLSAGTGLKHIHLEHFREFRVATPSLDEQERIFVRLDASGNNLLRERAYLQTVRNIKAGLMQDLLTGKVRVQADGAEEFAG